MSKETRCLLAITGAFNLGGGIAAVNRLVLRALSEEGYNIDILAMCEREATVDYRYVKLDRVTARAFSNQKIPFTLAVWRALLTDHYDLVMVDLINIASILALPGVLGWCRYVVWLYGTEIFSPYPNLEGHLGIWGAWKRIAISSFTRTQVADRYPALCFNVCELALDPVRHQFDPGFDPAVGRPVVNLEAVDGSQHALGNQVILNVGRMWVASLYKGQPVLIRAMAEILDSFPDAQLVMAGAGDGMSEMLAMIRSLPSSVQRAIFLPGFVSDDLLRQLYQACAVYAMPSAGEGFGLVYLEAMQWGKPCIGSRVDGAGTVILDGHTGMLVDDPNSVEELVIAIKSLLAQPEQASAMGWAGRESVHKHYLYLQFKERFLANLNIQAV